MRKVPAELTMTERGRSVSSNRRTARSYDGSMALMADGRQLSLESRLRVEAATGQLGPRRSDAGGEFLAAEVNGVPAIAKTYRELADMTAAPRPARWFAGRPVGGRPDG